MKQESQFKLQAYLDGELSANESVELAALLATDAEAKALLQELSFTNAALAGHETECRLPETREFFWSKIQREIERQEASERPITWQSWLAWVRRHLMPVSGFALVVIFCGLLAIRPGSTSAAPQGEMEMASDDMSSYTFRDQENNVTAVWLYDRNQDSSSTADSSPQ